MEERKGPKTMRLIDADALIKKWRESLNITENDKGAVFVGYHQIPSMINSMPTIVERKKAKWIIDENGQLKCSNCIKTPINRIIDHRNLIYNISDIKKVMKFCPLCGVDMRG